MTAHTIRIQLEAHSNGKLHTCLIQVDPAKMKRQKCGTPGDVLWHLIEQQGKQLAKQITQYNAQLPNVVATNALASGDLNLQPHVD